MLPWDLFSNFPIKNPWQLAKKKKNETKDIMYTKINTINLLYVI